MRIRTALVAAVAGAALLTGGVTPAKFTSSMTGGVKPAKFTSALSATGLRPACGASVQLTRAAQSPSRPAKVC